MKMVDPNKIPDTDVKRLSRDQWRWIVAPALLAIKQPLPQENQVQVRSSP
jgi:hypothetical protein